MARATFAALIVLVVGGAASARGAQAPLASRPPISNSSEAPSAVKVSAVAALEEQVGLAVNAQRVRRGLVPLRISRQLVRAARSHSMSMAEHGFFAHDSFEGLPFWKRIRAAYPALAGRVWRAGENLAWASPDLSAAQALDLWMSSPHHRQNLLAPAWRELGIGVVHALAAPGVYGGLDVTIVTADFGTR